MNSDTEHIASIVLAAGEGRRIGGNKALLALDGTTFLGKVVEALKAIGSNPIVVVGGAEYQQVEQMARELGFRLQCRLAKRAVLLAQGRYR